MRFKSLAAAVVVAGVLTGSAVAGASVLPQAPMAHIVSHHRTFCAPGGWEFLPSGEVLYNDVLSAGTRVCVRPEGADGFRVTAAHYAQPGWNAYPSLYDGCWAGLCSHHHQFPLPLADIESLSMTMRTLDPGATGDDSTDIWGWTHDPHHAKTTPDGFELMIWLHHHGVGASRHGRVLSIDGSRWLYLHWQQQINGITHWYLQFRLVSRGHRYFVGRNRPSTVRLPIMPFIQVGERSGLILHRDWIGCFKAGFEMVQGGAGLRIYQFLLHVRQVAFLQPPPRS